MAYDAHDEGKGIDHILKQAIMSQQETDGKKRKKKKNPLSNQVLESLKKGDGMRKDKDDTLLANTYDPDEGMKYEKTNKRRQRLKDLGGTDNLSYDDTIIEVIDETKSKGLKKKKLKKLENSDKDMIISDMAPTPVSVSKEAIKHKKKVKNDDVAIPMTEDPVTPLSSARKGKRTRKPRNDDVAVLVSEENTTPVTSPRDNKKKKKQRPEVSDNVLSEEIETPVTSPRGTKKKTRRPVSDDLLSKESDTATTNLKTRKKKTKPHTEDIEMSATEVTTSPVTSPRGRGKRRKNRPVDATASGDDLEAETAFTEEADDTELTEKVKTKGKRMKKKNVAKEDNEIEPTPTREVEDEGKILSVTIHRTDKLKNDFYILHPLVRVHVVDESTGKYLSKQHRNRPVTSYYESNNESVINILPIMTQPFDFKKQKSTLPVWEELLLFNENYNYFMQTDPKVIIFFELLDFVSINTANRQSAQHKQEGGRHRIAWAFLKVVGATGKVNTGNKVRLQLFQPPNRLRLRNDQVEIFQWWQSATRINYPSTLYVTLKGIIPPEVVDPAVRSMFATQAEQGRMTYKDLKKSMMHGSTNVEETPRHQLSSWSRLAGQVCRIPNNLSMSLSGGRKGCFMVNFSHDGRNLACACKDREGFPIFIYEIPSGELKGKFSGHFGIVYDLCWSKTDTHLLSASSDGTARVWNMQAFETAEKVLPHPTFVYTAKFHVRLDSLVATGAYDQVIRVWDVSGEDSHGLLLQEIENHQGHVNSLCFDEEGQKMYSGDSLGNLFVWNVYFTEQPSRRGFVRDWTLYQEIKEPELSGVAIIQLKLHPSGRRLLVHCRDNIIRMIDLRVQRIMQKYIGALHFREQIHSTISPCGTFVFSGSEDCASYVWNTETGDQVAMYSELNYQHPVTGIDYHPRDHMIALCALGENQPIYIYQYNPEVAQLSVGFPAMTKTPVSSPEKDVPKPTSVDLKTLAATISSARVDAMDESQTVLTKSDFHTQELARYEKVLRKLNTVTLSSNTSLVPDASMTGMSPGRGGYQTQTGTWGSTFDQAMPTPRTLGPSPAVFSPHATRTMSSTMQQQQFASQNLYMKQTDAGWRPGFSSVGKQGTARSASPTYFGRPPQISLTAGQGKAQFSFQAPSGKVLPNYQQVRALFDYKAQRSDELSIFQGDVINVLYKDSENWWMGELPDGQQGYFPANYVTTEGGDDDEADMKSQQRDDEPQKSKRNKKVTAVKSRSGELSFFSATDDSEDERVQKKSNRRRPSQEKLLLSNGKTSTRPKSKTRTHESTA